MLGLKNLFVIHVLAHIKGVSNTYFHHSELDIECVTECFFLKFSLIQNELFAENFREKPPSGQEKSVVKVTKALIVKGEI